MLKENSIPKLPGVYCVQNLVNNKIYIGSSKNLYRRFYGHKNGDCHKSFRCMTGLYNAYKKYGLNNFKFFVIKITEDYLLWEGLFIKLLKADYNIADVTNGKSQPNIKKKFDKNWISKLGKCKGHSKETRQKLTELNKQGSCKIIMKKDEIVLNFNSWAEAKNYFNLKENACAYFCKTKKGENYYWKGWIITKLNTQKKKVGLYKNFSLIKEFESAGECDRYLDLWRGVTSNAIKNNQGFLHEYTVKYL